MSHTSRAPPQSLRMPRAGRRDHVIWSRELVSIHQQSGSIKTGCDGWWPQSLLTASQGLKVRLYTPIILGGNSHLSWFYDRGAIKDQAHTGTSKGLSQAINRGPIRKFLPNYASVYATIRAMLSVQVYGPTM